MNHHENRMSSNDSTEENKSPYYSKKDANHVRILGSNNVENGVRTDSNELLMHTYFEKMNCFQSMVTSNNL